MRDMCQETRTRMCVLRLGMDLWLPLQWLLQRYPISEATFVPLFFLHILICVKLLLKCKTHCAPAAAETSQPIRGAFHYQLLLNVLILRLASASPSPPLARSFFFLYISLFLLSFSPHCCCCLVNTVLCFCFHVFASVCERRACCFYFLLIVA